ELREEARVDRDLVTAGIFEDDHRAALVGVVDAVLVSDRRPRGGEHSDREVMPMRERILALRIGHLLEVMAVALRERGDRRPQWGVGQEVVDRGHLSSMARLRKHDPAYGISRTASLRGMARLGLGLASLGRPGYLNIGH